MTRHLTRRQFVELSAGGLSAFALPVLRVRRAPLVLRVGFIASTGGTADDARLGFMLGLDEARHAAAMFGGSIEDVSLTPTRSSDRGLSAVVGADADAKASLSWIRHAADSGALYMNVGCHDDALRAADCSRVAFHVTPSDAMLRDAIAAAHLTEGATAQAWDSSLSRFGADTLNKRFTAQFHRPMTPASWSAWFAVKVLWESALRKKSADAKSIAEYLARETTQFDGHKGAALSFRPWDHQLRQPLYVVAGNRGPKDGVVEVPKLDPDASARDALDKLGVSGGAAQCKMAP
jgi:hypothetical protein